MMKLHYSVSDALDECLMIMENEDGVTSKPRRRLNQLAKMQYYQEMSQLELLQNKQKGKGFALCASNLPNDGSLRDLHATSCQDTGFPTSSLSDGTTDSSHDDDYDLASF
jgi:hypothetical protein